MSWINFGDANFVEYGGCLVKQHYTSRELLDYPNLASEYDVLWCQPSEEKKGVYLAAICTIDLDDYKTNEVVQAQTKEENAACVVEYFGILSLGGRTYSSQYPASISDAELSFDDLCLWLQQLGADKYIPEEYIQKIAYEKYKIDWIGQRHLTLRLISDTVEDFNDFLKECRRLGEPKTNYSFADYVDEFGFHGGVVWVCFDEFCGAEYQDKEYMEEILPAEDFATYKILRKNAVS